MPLTSVIIPAFNAERTLAGAIASVLEQGGTEVEVIVVDDCSTDGTARVACGDDRVRLVSQRWNQGPGAARNAGLAASRGDWVALLDADDSYQPGRLSTLLDQARAHGADTVADNLLLDDGSPNPQPMYPSSLLPTARVLDAVTFIEGNAGHGKGSRIGYGYLKPMISRPFLDRTGTRWEPLRYAEDYLFALRCLLEGARCLVIPQPLYRYRVGPGGLTDGHSAEDLVSVSRHERALMSHPSVLADPALAAALARHARRVDLAQGWFSFAQAIKRRQPRAAMAHAFRSPDDFTHIGREGLRAVPRALRRMAQMVVGEAR